MGQMLSSTKKRPPDAQVADELSRNVESLSEVESSASEAHEADAKGNLSVVKTESVHSKKTLSASVVETAVKENPEVVEEEIQPRPPPEAARRLSLSPEIEKKSSEFFKGQRRGSIKVNLTEAEHDEASKEYTHKNPSMLADESLSITLVPHVHTLFCERKERVCMSHGKLQEHEKIVISIKANDTGKFNSHCWYRSELPRDDKIMLWLTGAKYESIESTKGQIQYELTRDDVGKYLKFAPMDGISGETEMIETASVLGPVLPAPPRFMSFTIRGDLYPGKYLIADSDYTGGKEGASEFWWMRISKGERKILGDPVPLQEKHMKCDKFALQEKVNIVEHNDNDAHGDQQNLLEARGFLEADPRVYKLTQSDVGCIFKVKCRPVRSDGYKGEIFTSKPSGVIEALE